MKSFKLASNDRDSLKSDKLDAKNGGIECYIVDKEHTLCNLLNLIISEEK